MFGHKCDNLHNPGGGCEVPHLFCQKINATFERHKYIHTYGLATYWNNNITETNLLSIKVIVEATSYKKRVEIAKNRKHTPESGSVGRAETARDGDLI